MFIKTCRQFLDVTATRSMLSTLTGAPDAKTRECSFDGGQFHGGLQFFCGVKSDVSILRRHWQPLSVHILISLTNHNGNYVPYFFRTVCGFFNVLQIIRNKCCETGATVYRPYNPRRLEHLTIYRCRYKGSGPFSSVI